MSVGRQRWKCVRCGSIRAWGSGSPEDPYSEAMLLCDQCDAGHVPHRYLDVEFSDPYNVSRAIGTSV